MTAGPSCRILAAAQAPLKEGTCRRRPSGAAGRDRLDFSGVLLFGVFDESMTVSLASFVERGEADLMLAELVADDPEWERSLRVEEFEVADPFEP